MSDNVKVTPELRSEANLRKLARALIALAARKLEEEAEAADHHDVALGGTISHCSPLIIPCLHSAPAAAGRSGSR